MRDPQWKALSRHDWGEILELLEKKTYQRKFQIIEAFLKLAAQDGFHQVSHARIAKECGVTRPVVINHFPTEADLVALAYRYLYARLQKLCADGISSRQGATNQFKGYVEAIARWTFEHRDHASFLGQFFALLRTKVEYRDLFDRNLRIGRERIAAIGEEAQAEGQLGRLSPEALLARAASVQYQVFGFIVIESANVRAQALEETKLQELIRTCLHAMGLPAG
jgi:AcrR family transcriptional regulator